MTRRTGEINKRNNNMVYQGRQITLKSMKSIRKESVLADGKLLTLKNTRGREATITKEGDTYSYKKRAQQYRSRNKRI